MNFTQNIKRYFLPALLVAAVLVSVFKPSSENLSSYTYRIQDKLNNAETFFRQASQSEALRKVFSGNMRTAPVLESAARHNIQFFYYKGDSLAYWTANSAVLLSPWLIEEGTSAIKLKNGWYQAMKYSDTVRKEVVLGLVPVKYQYPFENRFLKNEFAVGIQVPRNIEISEESIKGIAPVKDLDGKTLFGLYESEGERGDYVNIMLLLSQIILLLVVFYYVHYFAANITEKRGFLPGFIYLLFSVIALRTVMLWFDQPSELYRLDLFHPANYASSVITKSLGDLLLNSLILIWVVLFWAVYRKRSETTLKPSPVLAGLFISIVFGFSAVVTWLFKTLVMDSVISFEVYNILSLSFYSLLGLICVALVLMAHFLVVRDVVRYLHQSGIRPAFITGFCVCAGLVFCVFAYNSQFYQSIIFSAMWTVLFIVIMYRMEQRSSWIPVKDLIVFIGFYSLLSTYFIENIYERKERNQRKFFAGKLVSERDFVAEYMFDDVARRISTDAFIKNFFGSPLVSQREIDDRLGSIYLSGYFNKYELKTYAYDKSGNSIRSSDTLPIGQFEQRLPGDSITSFKLQYITDTSQNYYYLAFFPFSSDSSFEGTLVLRLIPKVYYGQNVYPELLLGENISSLAEYSYYDYAVYQRDKLIVQHGDFPYTYYWPAEFDFGNRQYAYIDIGDWEHNIQRFGNDKKVVVTIGQEGLFEPVATFSYLFSFFFIVIVVARLIAVVSRGAAQDENILNWFTISFRTRINYSMLLMIITSFVIIGFITISFFRKQYDNFYNERLLRKEKVVHASLEYFLQQNSGDVRNLRDERLKSALSFEVARMAEINEIDINLYDHDGDLAVASQPGIYDKGILSKKMNPAAYFELAKTKGTLVNEQEQVGTLKYMATYAPVRNNAGEAIAYLGIPYFAKSKNINDEVSSFLVALMNVYVFLLICAAILAFFISNSITRPLTIISEKLRILNLNKKNEPIEWKSQDEIGILIGEYNKMIEELEHSAKKLARSERESAWREMAKQIAHEIKNPLTPMKLGIQYLQRAIDAGDPNIEQLAKRVARTLEEQIENLSSIATAFSSFAKMPKAQNEIINLNELLRSIVDLFNREDQATITFTTESESPQVFADRNQLVSVFNNLVKNALQSIPEQRKGFIDINIKEENGWVQVSVSDNGGGIPAKLYEKVFVPNFTTKSSGTGLGLAITRQIIEGAGGRIWFESAENVGTTFFVKLQKSETV